MRNNATKPVRINVKQSEIREKTKLFREITGNVTMVKVDANNDKKGTV